MFEVRLHALQTMTEQLQLREWGALSSWKSASFFRNNAWVMEGT
jgi:hypothetical protein